MFWRLSGLSLQEHLWGHLRRDGNKNLFSQSDQFEERIRDTQWAGVVESQSGVQNRPFAKQDWILKWIQKKLFLYHKNSSLWPSKCEMYSTIFDSHLDAACCGVIPAVYSNVYVARVLSCICLRNGRQPHEAVCVRMDGLSIRLHLLTVLSTKQTKCILLLFFFLRGDWRKMLMFLLFFLLISKVI